MTEETIEDKARSAAPKERRGAIADSEMALQCLKRRCNVWNGAAMALRRKREVVVSAVEKGREECLEIYNFTE